MHLNLPISKNFTFDLSLLTTREFISYELKIPISLSRFIMERLKIVIEVGRAISESCALSKISIFDGSRK